MNAEHCIICGKFWNDSSLVCDSCEAAFWRDEKAVLDYFHFCGIPATIEQVRGLLEAQP